MIVKYQALNKKGTLVADSLAIADVAAARTELMRRGLTPVNIEVTGKKAGDSAFSLQKLFQRDSITAADPRKASKRHLPVFTAQMSILLETGTTVAASLSAIEKQITCPHWRELIHRLSQHVEEGGSLASAVNLYPQVFDPVYASMISAGESSGNLEEIFRRLAELARQADRIRSKVVSAMVYPAVLSVIAFSVLSVLIFFVLPRFEELFIEMKVNLPASTSALLALSHVVRDNALIVIVALAAGIFGLVTWLRSAAGKRFIQIMSIKVPIVGPLVCSITNARIFRLLGLLVTSNVSLVESLELTTTATRNTRYKELMETMRESVLEGQTMYDVLGRSSLLDPSIAEMVNTAEQNGQIGKVMTMLADHLDDENNTKVNMLTSIMEPIILLFMGIIVGIVAVSLVLPMFDLSQISA